MSTQQTLFPMQPYMVGKEIKQTKEIQSNVTGVHTNPNMVGMIMTNDSVTHDSSSHLSNDSSSLSLSSTQHISSSPVRHENKLDDNALVTQKYDEIVKWAKQHISIDQKKQFQSEMKKQYDAKCSSEQICATIVQSFLFQPQIILDVNSVRLLFRIYTNKRLTPHERELALMEFCRQLKLQSVPL